MFTFKIVVLISLIYICKIQKNSTQFNLMERDKFIKAQLNRKKQFTVKKFSFVSVVLPHIIHTL